MFPKLKVLLFCFGALYIPMNLVHNRLCSACEPALNPIVHFFLHHMYCSPHTWIPHQQKGWHMGRWGAVQMGAARLGCKGTWLTPSGPILAPGHMNRFGKCFSQLVGGSYLAEKAAWVLNSVCQPRMLTRLLHAR